MDLMLKKKHTFLILGFFTFLLCFTAYLSVLSLFESPLSNAQREDGSNDIGDIKRPHSSASWKLYNNITIDATATGVGAQNWTWAVSQAWCSGSGILNDPYLLENITIYINNTVTACINISNSKNVYFKISSCIVRNNASDYGIGISLSNCADGFIDTVTASNNGDDGIYLLNSQNISIDTSTMNSNHHYGLNMDNTTISTITTTTMNLNLGGAYLINSTYNVFQTSSNLNNNTDGLILIDSDLNNVTSCNFYNNTDNGIELLNSDNCIITNNDIEDNIAIGIYIYDETGNSENNELYGNDFDTNTLNAEDNSTGAGNTWDNGVDSGNEWDDYSGADLDDDGIGDDPYNISGSASAQDQYPVWDDDDSIAPEITIVAPTSRGIHGVAPSFSLTIVEAVGISVRWYTLDGGTHNTTFTGTTGVISTTEFNRISGVPGQFVSFTLTFYINDTTGNLGSASVTLRKYFAPAVEHGEEDEEIFMYAFSQNQIYLLCAFAFVLNLVLLRFMIYPKKK